MKIMHYARCKQQNAKLDFILTVILFCVLLDPEHCLDPASLQLRVKNKLDICRSNSTCKIHLY